MQKKIIKILLPTVLGTILIPIIGFIAWDQLTAPPYLLRVVGEEALNNQEKSYLKDNFNISDNENIINVYSLYRNIKSGGIILTNKRLISFLEGENFESCLYARLDDIEAINIEQSDSFINYSTIKIKLKDSTHFTFDVSPAENMDNFLYERILKKIKN